MFVFWRVVLSFVMPFMVVLETTRGRRPRWDAGLSVGLVVDSQGELGGGLDALEQVSRDLVAVSSARSAASSPPA